MTDNKSSVERCYLHLWWFYFYYFPKYRKRRSGHKFYFLRGSNEWSLGSLSEKKTGLCGKNSLNLVQVEAPKVLLNCFVSHTADKPKPPFFAFWNKSVVDCYFLLLGDKGCWKFRLVASIWLSCPKDGSLEKTQHYKNSHIDCQGLANSLRNAAILKSFPFFLTMF